MLPEAQDGEQENEWNVLFYLCGTDLESRLAAASFNLKEIADTIPGDGFYVDYDNGRLHY